MPLVSADHSYYRSAALHELLQLLLRASCSPVSDLHFCPFVRPIIVRAYVAAYVHRYARAKRQQLSGLVERTGPWRLATVSETHNARVNV
jgi:hypothetical protein